MYLFAPSPGPQDLSGEEMMGSEEGPAFPSFLPSAAGEAIRIFVLGSQSHLTQLKEFLSFSLKNKILNFSPATVAQCLNIHL